MTYPFKNKKIIIKSNSILISFLLKSYEIPKTEINRFINDFEKLTEEFRNKISINIYNQVIYTDNKLKLNALRNYIKK